MKITRLDEPKILYYEFDEKSHANTNKVGRSEPEKATAELLPVI